MDNDEKSYQICLSSEIQNKDLVKKLYKKLTKVYKLKVLWLNKPKKGHTTNIERNIKNDIKSSQVFLCCVTKRYVENKDCMQHMLTAHEYKLPGIIALLEPILTYNIESLKFTTKWSQFNFYETRSMFYKWEGDTWDDLIEKLAQLLHIKKLKNRASSKCC